MEEPLLDSTETSSSRQTHVDSSLPSSETSKKLERIRSLLSLKTSSLKAQYTANQGIFVVADQVAKAGTLLVSSKANRIALDSPYWSTHCAWCTGKTDVELCSTCQVIGSCSNCRGQHPHQRECSLLEQLPRELVQDSSHLLVVRLLVSGELDDLECLYEHAIPDDQQDLVDNLSRILAPTANVSYASIFARVLGCSHGITDVSLPLGRQVLGRAVFWHHSFFNHSCAPNAFLSFDRGVAHVHVLKNVEKGEPITLSYIPMSGRFRSERRELLLRHYGFHCQCCECGKPDALDLDLSQVDLQSIREVQYSCNERILNAQDDPDSIRSMIKMTQRGIRNGGISPHHEVSLETHRLLALLDRDVQEHEAFFRDVQTFDPVTLATQRLEYARALSEDPVKQEDQYETALRELEAALGSNHSWVVQIRKEISDAKEVTRSTKRARKETHKR